MAEKEELLKVFPRQIREKLNRLPVDFKEIRELRIRAERPLFFTGKEGEYLVTQEGGCIRAEGFPGMPARERPLIITGGQMKEIVEFMGSFSLYASQEELCRGFLTLQGGHRIGVAGKVVEEKGNIRLMKAISFLNIRVAHEIKGCADRVVDSLVSSDGHCLNTLILSPPGGGKTTLLRDIIRQMSNGYFSRKTGQWVAGRQVGVVDERCELGACFNGIPQMDLGMRTDVLDGCPKSQGMMMLVRSMSPAVIAVDEIGGKEDISAIEYVKNCGCSLAATLHAVSLEDAFKKPGIGALLREGAFERILLLDAEKGPGHLAGIFDGQGTPLKGGMK